MEKERVSSIIDIYNKLKKRANWEQHWYEVSRLVIPRRDQVFDTFNKTKGDKKRRDQYDASSEHYMELLASALHSMLTNPTLNWFELTTDNRELNKDVKVRRYLQKLVRHIHQVLNNSNFQTAIHEVYIDLASLGTSVLRIEEDDETIMRFKSSPINEHYIMEDFKGQVDTIYTEVSMTVRQAVQEFGKEAFENSKLKKLLKSPTENMNILHVVRPRKDILVEKKGPKNFAFESVYIDLTTETLMKESGFREFPYAVSRWNKSSGEMYGRSPAMKALPDIKMINSMMRDTIRAAQKRTDPPMFLPDEGIIGPINITPGGINFYRAGTPSRDGSLFKSFGTEANPSIGIDIMRDVRERIKNAFFIDQLQLRDGPQMTATEVNQRTDEHLRLLGPILGRLHYELLKPLISRIISIMKRRNEMPPGMPDALANSNIDVFFSSQIARAQRMSEGNNLLRTFNMIGPMLEGSPESADIIDFDEAVRFAADINGLPDELLKTKEAVEELRQQRAEAQQRQQQQQEQLMQAETMNKAAPMIKG